MPSQLISRGDIMSHAEIPRDVMTFWIRGGLLRPVEMPKGPGKHLRFEWYELSIAAVMDQLRLLGVSLKGMLSVAEAYREAIAWGERYGIVREDIFAIGTLDNAYSKHAEGRFTDAELAEWIEQLGHEKHGGWRVTDRIKALHASMSMAEFKQYSKTFLTIMDVPTRDGVDDELTYFWRAGGDESYRSEWGAGALKTAADDGAVALFALAVSRILLKVWQRMEEGA